MAILIDSDNVISPEMLDKLSNKLSRGIARLYSSSKSGGNPFLFSFVLGKTHYIDKNLKTAATDGINFYWGADFLDKLSINSNNNELAFVLMHETYHIALHHTSYERVKFRHKYKWNLAIDFIVNGLIFEDLKKYNRDYTILGNTFSSTVLSIDDVINQKKIQDKKKVILLDSSTRNIATGEGMTAEQIYDLLPDTDDNYGEDCKYFFDDHLDISNKDEILKSLEKAKTFSESFARGETPAGIQEIIKELYEPTLMMEDLVMSASFRKRLNNGLKNDRGRYRKRFLGFSEPLYYNQKYSNEPKWVCLLDTSGSMSDLDIAKGISQLKCLGDSLSGVIVPCDSVPYWENTTSIDNIDDLSRTNIKGRGGTVFELFFKQLGDKLGYNFDCVIVITDGYCDQIDKKYQPPIDVVWVVTSNFKQFSPSFGRVAPLLSPL